MRNLHIFGCYTGAVDESNRYTLYMYMLCTLHVPPPMDRHRSPAAGRRYLLESFLHQSACAVHVRHKSTPPLMLVICSESEDCKSHWRKSESK